MMKNKAHNQSRLMRIITIPIRALVKARDMYVRGMTSTEFRYGSAMGGGQANHFSNSLPKSFSSRSSRSNENDDFSELIRAASARTYGGRIDVDAILRQQQQQAVRQPPPMTTTAVGSTGLPKSTSVGMGKIDEDKPIDFGQDGGDLMKPDLFPRSRSYAVTKRKLGF